jgi:hypothetical protein
MLGGIDGIDWGGWSDPQLTAEALSSMAQGAWVVSLQGVKVIIEGKFEDITEDITEGIGAAWHYHMCVF